MNIMPMYLNENEQFASINAMAESNANDTAEVAE